eukprot:EG_transcript_62
MELIGGLLPSKSAATPPRAAAVRGARTRALQAMVDSLKVRSPALRAKASRDLLNFVLEELRGSPQNLSAMLAELNAIIHQQVNSQEQSELLAGIAAIDVLLEVELNATQMAIFGSYLRLAIINSDQGSVPAVAAVLGRLVKYGGILTADVVDREAKKALDWLESPDTKEAKKYAAVVVLRELASNAPTIFYNLLDSFTSLIWSAVRDPSQQIREAAAESVRAVLEIMAERDSRHNTIWYDHFYHKSLDGLEQKAHECVHGSLLVIAELFRAQPPLINTKYEMIGTPVLRLRDHPNRNVRQAVMELLPFMARYRVDLFCQKFGAEAVAFLLAVVQRDTERIPLAPHAYAALARLVRIIGGGFMQPWVPQLLASIHQTLLYARGKPHIPEALTLLASLCVVVPEEVSEGQVVLLLDSIFQWPLTLSLSEDLTDISATFPQLTPELQARLLNAISLALCLTPFGSGAAAYASGHDRARAMVAAPPAAGGLPPRTAAYEGLDAVRSLQDKTLLALRMLRRSRFDNHRLGEFVRDAITPFMDNESAAVRREAALTCCKLAINEPPEMDPHVFMDSVYRSPELASYPRIHFNATEDSLRRHEQSTYHRDAVLAEILERLLGAALSDADPDIRFAILASLDNRYDHSLCQPDKLQLLMAAVNDEDRRVRETAIATLGRLSPLNASGVLPVLRQTTLQLLAEVEHSVDSRHLEAAAGMLAALVQSAPAMSQMYAARIVEVLQPRLTDPSPPVVVAVLAALGNLATAVGPPMLRFLPAVAPVVIDTLNDRSSAAKRAAALRCLGQLCQSTGYVSHPYLRHPNLFTNLRAVVQQGANEGPESRQELVRVLGILGAVDPFKLMVLQDEDEEKRKSLRLPSMAAQAANANGGLKANQLRSPDYYTEAALDALVDILRDATLSPFHWAAIQAVMSICTHLGAKCAPFLGLVVPSFLRLFTAESRDNQRYVVSQLGRIVQIGRRGMAPYLTGVMDLLPAAISDAELRPGLLNLCVNVALHLGEEARPCLATTLPVLLRLFREDSSETLLTSRKVLYTLAAFDNHLCDHLPPVVTTLMRAVGSEDVPLLLRVAALKTLRRLIGVEGIEAHASSVIHPIVRLLSSPYQVLKRDAMLVLCSLVYKLGPQYTHYVQLVQRAMTLHRVSHPFYETLVATLLKGGCPLPPPGDEGADLVTLSALREILLPGDTMEADTTAEETDDSLVVVNLNLDEPENRKLVVNQAALRRVVEQAKNKTTKEDWEDWLKKFGVELLQQSPQLPLRYCSALANQYQPLAKELFNVAFVSVWNEMSDKTKEDVERSLEVALMHDSITPEAMQTLLNLAEFMEIHDMPMHLANLAALAEKSQAYAKALRWKEIEFQNSPHSCIDELVSINTQLQRPESALGLLIFAAKEYGVKERHSWNEKLGRWPEALRVFTEELDSLPEGDERAAPLVLGKMRCLAALSEWRGLLAECRRIWRYEVRQYDEEAGTVQQELAPLAVGAAWHLGEWDFMAECVDKLPAATLDSAFYKAVLCVHRQDYQAAQAQIAAARGLLYNEVAALLTESYSRAYDHIVQCQKLTELEEVMQYKLGTPDRREALRAMWLVRLKGAAANVEHWKDLLAVQSLVLRPQEDLEIWMEFVQLCQRMGDHSMERRTLLQLLGEDDDCTTFDMARLVEDEAPYPPRVAIAYLQHAWATGDKLQACLNLERFLARGGAGGADAHFSAKCHVTLGEWEAALLADGVVPPSAGKDMAATLQRYKRALELDPRWYKAWHAWALANEAVMAAKRTAGRGKCTAEVVEHIVCAARGFISSIKYGRNKSVVLQDALRLLTIWFDFGHLPEVERVLEEGLETVNTDTWLLVLPQIVARMHVKSPAIKRLIIKSMTRIGTQSPQALIPPLTVALNSTSLERRAVAAEILGTMKKLYPNLVEQASFVSQELIRCAIIWIEMWHEALEEASKLYFGQRNITGMLNTLAPLHAMMRKTETLREVSFVQSYGRDLQEALEWCRSYQRTGDEQDINQAWELYYSIFKRLNGLLFQQQSTTTLELQCVSPKLHEAKDLELAMPGLVGTHNVTHIASFHPEMTVMPSKQRPRKLTILGSDGVQYKYLLKGHEDLRLDERVMQLFGLVNALLQSDPVSSKLNLIITRYAVIPQSANAGIIGWVDNCDTMHQLVKDFREKKKVFINVEHRHINAMTVQTDADNLPLIKKVELFEYAMESTTGQDLYKVLWLQSPNSEVWLNRRTLYARSLAAMSMVGYILGLGDRHPNNLMIQRVTGKVVHIDFGDCFEVAMNRDKFPERIPFRLTRMLVNAMEVSGIEGNYRFTCEQVMRVLRDNKDSVMAMLEAFAHDPLISWRLVGKDKKADGEVQTDAAPNAIGQLVEEQDNQRLARGESIHPERQTMKCSPVEDTQDVNQRAYSVIKRIADKLSGTEFRSSTLDLPSDDTPFSVAKQVDKLIQQATSVENLCQCYIGWCPFW